MEGCVGSVDEVFGCVDKRFLQEVEGWLDGGVADDVASASWRSEGFSIVGPVPIISGQQSSDQHLVSPVEKRGIYRSTVTTIAVTSTTYSDIIILHSAALLVLNLKVV